MKEKETIRKGNPTMKQNRKRMCMTLLLLTAGVLAACGGGEETTAVTTDVETTGTKTAAETEVLFDDGMPERDMEGYTLTFLNYTDSALFWALKDINRAEETGDQVNDAIFARNRRIEERYNAVITELYSDTVIDTFRNQVMAGATDFTLAQIYDVMANSLHIAGTLLTWDNLPMINLEAEWWNQDANASFQVNGAQFAAVGDFNLSEYSKSYLYFFNKDLYKSLGYDDDLYQLVRDGKWTKDKMLEIAKDAAKDLNGDGKMDLNDQYGLAETAKIHFQLLITGAGYKYIDVDRDGNPYFTISGNESLISYMQELVDDHTDTSWYYMSEKPNGACPNEAFQPGNTLFISSTMWDTEYYRDYDFDIGMLPAPKADEAQEKYYTITVGGLVTVLPKTLSDAENVGILLESLAADSRYTCLPVYKEVTLQSKYARDEGSADMIDIIFDTQTYDLGVTTWGDVRTQFSESIFQKLSTDIVSKVTKMEKTITKEIQKTIDALDEE